MPSSSHPEPIAPGPSGGPSGGSSGGDRRAQRALGGIHAGLARLRRVDDPASLIRLVPEEVCRSLGFERSLLFRVDGERLIAESAHVRGDAARSARMLSSWRARSLQLPELPLESEMVRRREPLMTAEGEAEAAAGAAGPDAGAVDLGAPAMRPAVTGWYVSAPIVSEGRVVGLLDADRKGQAQGVDELDQMILSVFADGFACIFERATLRERLHAQLAQVREVMDTTGQLLDEVIETEVEVGLVDQQISTSVAQAASSIAETGTAGGHAPSASLLTVREVEVIDLIAAGETNAGIAARLLISESTVKSHVKHILRKLGASHRAEAVSRHLSATGRR